MLFLTVSLASIWKLVCFFASLPINKYFVCVLCIILFVIVHFIVKMDDKVVSTCRLLLNETLLKIPLKNKKDIIENSKTLFYLLKNQCPCENTVGLFNDVVTMLCLPYFDETVDQYEDVSRIYTDFVFFACEQDERLRGNVINRCLNFLKSLVKSHENVKLKGVVHLKLKLLKMLLFDSFHGEDFSLARKEVVQISFQILLVDDINESIFIKICNFVKEFFHNSDDHEAKCFFSTLKKLHIMDQDKKLFILIATNLSFLSQSTIITTAEFWLILQTGLTSNDPLTRKRSLYIVKWFLDYISKLNDFASDIYITHNPIISWCKEDDSLLWDMWKSYILVMESLEEKQIHVIQPILPLLSQLYEKACTNTIQCTLHLHFTWIMKILHRAMYHESKILVKWSLQFFLAIDFKSFPILKDQSFDFIFNQMFDVLKQTFLFVKEESNNIGSPPAVLKPLERFFNNLMDVLEYEVQLIFVDKLLFLLTESKFSDISLLYIIIAFTKVVLKGNLQKQQLSAIKQLLFSIETKYQVQYQRVALQLLSLFSFNNINVRKNEINDIKAIFIHGLAPNTITSNYLNCWYSWMKGNKEELAKNTDFDSNIVKYFNSTQTLSSQQINECFFHMIVLTLCLDDNTVINQLTSIAVDIIHSARNNSYYPKLKILNLLKYFNTINCLIRNAYKLESSANGLKAFKTFQVVHFNIYESFLEYFFFIFDSFNNEVEDIARECFFMIDSFISPQVIKNRALPEKYCEFIIKFINKGKSYLDVILKNIESKFYEQQFLMLKLLNKQLPFIKDIELIKDIYKTISFLLTNVKRVDLYTYFKSADWKYTDSGQYLELLWSNVKLCLEMSLNCQNAFVDKKDINILFDVYVGDLDLISLDKVSTVVQVSKCFVDFFENDAEKSLFLCETLWRILKTQTQNDHSFWNVYNSCIDTIFHEKFLLSSQEKVKATLQKYWNLIHEFGIQKSGLINKLTDNCLLVWININDEKTACLESLMYFINELIMLSIFGSAYKKHQKGHNDFMDYLTLSTSYEGLEDLQSVHQKDQEVRLKLINFILNLNTNNTTKIFFETMIVELVNYDLKLSTNRKHAYYPNSDTHRIKIRLWQLVLVLLNKLENDFDYVGLTRTIFEVLYYDNQPSIKRYIEWSLIIIFQHCNKSIEIFWDYFKTGTEKKITTVVSVLSIAFYLTKLFDGEFFVDYCCSVIPLIVPWTQGQHMTSRIHAQATLRMIWEKIMNNNYQELGQQFHWVEYFFTLTERNSSAIKHRNELLSNFFYSKFHPLDHYSLESIFHGILSQSDVMSDEFILVEKFQFAPGKIENGSPVNLKKYDSEIKSVKICDKVEGENLCGSPPSPLVDIQKKIMPWNILPSADDAALNSELEKKRDSQLSELILCAVLVEKIPNIGGLCRTSEIFGVSKFLVGSYRYLSDPNFKSLSVSAEKWIDIEQVLPIKLAAYLKDMKSDGYRIVGVEQTANSKKIGEYKFPKKSLLVLGNEKTGIPVDVIQLVDECVEIPQVGIIRSLNVHISGAIMIWEYCKQNLF